MHKFIFFKKGIKLKFLSCYQVHDQISAEDVNISKPWLNLIWRIYEVAVALSLLKEL